MLYILSSSLTSSVQSSLLEVEWCNNTWKRYDLENNSPDMAENKNSMYIS
jgi:hypothetical protein